MKKKEIKGKQDSGKVFLIRLYRKKRHSLDSYIKQAESEEKFGMHYTRHAD